MGRLTGMGELRAIGSSRIQFGLVVIPVKLYSASREAEAISFNMLHRPPCSSRLKQQYVCAREEVVVPRDEIVKGYEFAKDQFVVFTAEELKALEERTSPSIDIDEFVPLKQVDPIYFDKPYYLGAEKGAERAYRLLADVMQETGRTALARYAARGKQHLVMVRPIDSRLVMQQLLYADEVRRIDEVPMHDAAAPSGPERKLARQLIEQRATEAFWPDGYRDDVKDRIRADIDRKVQGQEIQAVSPVDGPHTELVDLVEALKASIEAGSKRSSPRPKKTRKGKAAA
jgi:DNA end-binding protein Ku